MGNRNNRCTSTPAPKRKEKNTSLLNNSNEHKLPNTKSNKQLKVSYNFSSTLIQQKLPEPMYNIMAFYSKSTEKIFIMGAYDNKNIYTYNNNNFTKINKYPIKQAPISHNIVNYIDSSTHNEICLSFGGTGQKCQHFLEYNITNNTWNNIQKNSKIDLHEMM